MNCPVCQNEMLITPHTDNGNWTLSCRTDNCILNWLSPFRTKKAAQQAAGTGKVYPDTCQNMSDKEPGK